MDHPDRPAFAPRLVVSGHDAAGRSEITFDGTPSIRHEGVTASMVPLWQVDALPVSILAPSGEIDPVKFAPPQTGFRAVILEMRPDAERGTAEEQRQAFADYLERIGTNHVGGHDVHPGMHRNDSVELIVMISGELHVIFDKGETVLRPGDTLVQRGTNHAWSNRGTEVVRYLFVTWGATPRTDGET